MAVNLYRNKDANIRKTWILMSLFFILVMIIGWFIGWFYSEPAIFWIALIFALFMNIFSYWYSDKIVVRISGAKEVSKEKLPELYNIVENLSITAGLPMPKLYIIKDEVPNAFATGRNPENAAVAVTTGLLKILDRSELEGVLAHELSHIGNRDILVSTIVVVLVGFITLLSDFFIRSSFWGGGRREGGGGVIAIIGIILIVLSPIIGTLIQLAISRKREYLADSSGALLTRYPEGLANALKKISAHSGKMERANHATAHLYISNPFGGKSKKTSFIDKAFSTHPPVEDRIKALTESQ